MSKFSMPPFDLVETLYELSVLKRHFHFVVKQIGLESSDLERKIDELLNSGLYDFSDFEDHSELGYEIYELSRLAEEVNLKMIMNPFLVSLWSSFESITTRVVNLSKRAENPNSELKKKEGESYLDCVLRHYKSTSSYSEILNSNQVVDLDNFRKLRNCIAHNGGRLKSPDTELATRISIGELRGVSLTRDNYVVLSLEYVEAIFNLVYDHIQSLLRSYKKTDIGN